MSGFALLVGTEMPTTPQTQSATLTSAAAGSVTAFEPSEARLLSKHLPTDTCPHCARRSGEVSTVVRSAGTLKNPGRLVAVALLSSLAVISLVAAFPLLLMYVRHNERAVPLEVRVCHACDARLRREHKRTLLGYRVAGALPPVALFGLAAFAASFPFAEPIVPIILGESALLALATVGVMFIRRRQRRRLPFVTGFDGKAWTVELPASWRSVLSGEAARLLDGEVSGVTASHVEVRR